VARLLLSMTMASILVLSVDTGCSEQSVDFSRIQAPSRAAELNAYEVFVGEWDWEATVDRADVGSRDWTGNATWQWTLDDRVLHGEMTLRCDDAEFDAEGMWSWHPNERDYIWSMYNNWGYPQRGEAEYDDDEGTWTMEYSGVGLDGTSGYGVYRIDVSDRDMLKYEWTEWADALHMVEKIHVRGSYTRRS